MIRSLILALPLVAFAASAADIDCNKAITQTDMNMCADKDYQAADKKLNDIYRKVMAAEEGKDELKAAQRAWIVFRDAECTFETAGSEGGSIHPMEYSMCLTKLTKARTKELGAYFACDKSMKLCGG